MEFDILTNTVRDIAAPYTPAELERMAALDTFAMSTLEGFPVQQVSWNY